jgi:hypothetical protein
MECEDGRTLTPGLRTDARGHVLVSFGDKPDAPRRGLHRLSLHYSIALTEAEVTDGSAAVFSFALPAFAVDLKQVDLLVQAPPGTQLVRPDPDAALSFEHQENADHIVVHMHRARLPRTLHFGVELVLPVEIAHALQTKRSGAAASGSMGPLLASALVLLLCALKRRAASVSAELCRVQPRPLLELAAAWRAALMFGAALAAAASYDKRPELGLASLALCVGLALERGFGPAATTTTTTTTTTTATTTASARTATWTRILFGGASWLDATTPLGAALLGSAYALAFLRLALGQGPGLWLETLLLATPLWLTGTRMQMQDVARRALDSPGPGSAHHARSADAGLRAPDRAA